MNCRDKKWQRRANRRFPFERLEPRLLLNADIGAWPGNTGGLAVDTDSFDPTSVLVRYAPEVLDQLDFSQLELPGGSQFAPAVSLLPGFRRVQLGSSATVESALASLRSQPGVLYAEPNYRVYASALPNDPRFSELWGMDNTGQTGGTIDADIDMPDAWEGNTGSGNTIVAVIDTGVDYTHPDLAGNMWVNGGEIPADQIDNDGNGYVDDVYGYDFVNDDGDPFDDNRHGTHVAGTIAAVGNNGIGVAGVNWNAQIMALKFLDAQGSGTVGDAIAAIDYAVANGATVSNNSWGGNDGFSQSLYDAIDRARLADHIFVAAAGNGNFLGIGKNNDNQPFYPAGFDLDNIVAVAATDNNDSRATFSNYGASTVDLGAPGVGILSTTPGNTYSLLSGTSMATPHVSGAVALLRDVRPEWTSQQTIDQILSTVDPNASLSGRTVTGGRLNVAAALQGALDPAAEIQVLTSLGAGVEDGTGLVDLGTTAPGFPLTESFVVRNVGTLPLTLQEPITVPGGFTLLSSFGSTTLPAGGSTTFSIRLDAGGETSASGTVSFGNDDANENPFDFTIQGSVVIPAAVQIMDDGDAGFDTVGEWTRWTGQGYQDDIDESLAGTGADEASWTFSALTVGTYRVAATWSSYKNRATNAPFSIWNGGTLLASFQLNQQVPADDFAEAGVNWEKLGGLYQIDTSKLIVKLNDNANGRLNADAIRIERLPDDPEIQVSESGTNVDDGVTTVDFGETSQGLAVTKTFTVTNQGVQPLVLNEPVNVPPGFQVVTSFGTTTLGTGASTTFVVQLDAQSQGQPSGPLSFGNNDADENPFDFTVRGTVSAPVPVVKIVDNGDADFSTVGEWTRWMGQGYQSDIHESLPGAGTDVASWTFPGLAAGVYRVAATWTPYVNRASNAPFSIWDGTTPLGSQLVNQQLAADDFTAEGAAWEYLGGLFQVDSGTLVVKLADNADGRLNADAIRVESAPLEADIEVAAAGVDIADGTGSVSFGATSQSVPVTRIFTVTNVGQGALVLNEPISVPSGFQLVSSFGATTLAIGDSTSFSVQMTAQDLGPQSGNISFGNNDPDENPFDFAVTGTINPPPPAIQILDNGDAGFTTVGEWTLWGGQGFQNDIHESLPGTGADVASWTFSGLPTGIYRLAATWSSYTNRATDAPFSIWDDTTLLDSVAVNQQMAPGDFSAAGVSWETIGGLYQVTSGQLVVQLTDNANGRLNADAIRIERLPNEPDIEVASGAVVVVDNVGSVDFGATSQGVPVSRTFSVTNFGQQTLTLAEPINVPAGFQVDSSFAKTTLAVGETTTFVIKMDAQAMGTPSGEVTFANNDPDENPFNFAISGTVNPPPPAVQIIDNGAAGFSTVGPWQRWTGQGYENDIHEDLPGSGADVASWTFSGLPAGSYRVAATWSSYSNRATDAPFSVLDDATLLGTVLVNQQLAANDFSAAGASWKNLGGTYQVNSGKLIVELRDNANGRLNADAIRIERVTSLASIDPAGLTLGGGAMPNIVAGIGLPAAGRIATRFRPAGPAQLAGVEADPRDGTLQLPVTPVQAEPLHRSGNVRHEAFAQWQEIGVVDESLLGALALGLAGPSLAAPLT